MARDIAGVVCGLVAWFVGATMLNVLMRVSWPGYADAESPMTFTPAMMAARLLVGAFSSIVAGWVLARIAKRSGKPALALGILLIALFIPVHYGLWDKLPVWYHLTFLVSLVPFALLGARLMSPKAARSA